MNFYYSSKAWLNWRISSVSYHIHCFFPLQDKFNIKEKIIKISFVSWLRWLAAGEWLESIVLLNFCWILFNRIFPNILLLTWSSLYAWYIPSGRCVPNFSPFCKLLWISLYLSYPCHQFCKVLGISWCEIAAKKRQRFCLHALSKVVMVKLWAIDKMTSVLKV